MMARRSQHHSVWYPGLARSLALSLSALGRLAEQVPLGRTLGLVHLRRT